MKWHIWITELHTITSGSWIFGHFSGRMNFCFIQVLTGVYCFEDWRVNRLDVYQRQGLKIMHVSLYRNHHTAAILYFKDGYTRVVASGATGTGTDDEPFQELAIPAKTIIINENRLHQGDLEREIYHECGHYEWHAMFFELQQLHAADLHLLEYTETDKASKPAEKDIRWVERQASFVGIAAMFPRPVSTPLVHRYWSEVANSQDNLGQKISSVIHSISAEQQKPK